MSIPVEIDRLAEALSGFGAGYLLSTGGDGRVKAVTVEPAVEEGLLTCPPSKGSAANIEVNPAVTVLFPPRERRGYTLIVDGAAEVTGGGIAVRPLTAVLHRPADHADGPAAPGGCGNDCAPVT